MNGATLVPANNITVYIEIAIPPIFQPNCLTSATNKGTASAIPPTNKILMIVKPA